MENNDWGSINQAKEELTEDINNLNNGIYKEPLPKESPIQENSEEYRRERLRVDSKDIREEARKNLSKRLDKDFNISDFKAKTKENEYIRNNNKSLTILDAFKEKFAETKNKIIAGTIAGILAITTIAYGEFQRDSFEEHIKTDDSAGIIPTKEEFEAGLSEEQIIAKRQQTKAEEETINKIMNNEEVTQEELNNLTTIENIQTNPTIR